METIRNDETIMRRLIRRMDGLYYEGPASEVLTLEQIEELRSGVVQRFSPEQIARMTNLVSLPITPASPTADTVGMSEERFQIDTTGWLPLSAVSVPEAVFDANGRRKSNTGDRCVVCNLPVNPKTAKSVQCTTNGFFIPVNAYSTVLSEGETNQDGKRGSVESQGCWYIGPECAKRLPDGYTTQPSK